MWRAAALASYRFNPEWSATFDARYSGVQYRTLNNADVNGFTYQGVSKFFTADVRVVCKINKTVTAAVGIDNVKTTSTGIFTGIRSAVIRQICGQIFSD